MQCGIRVLCSVGYSVCSVGLGFSVCSVGVGCGFLCYSFAVNNSVEARTWQKVRSLCAGSIRLNALIQDPNIQGAAAAANRVISLQAGEDRQERV